MSVPILKRRFCNLLHISLISYQDILLCFESFMSLLLVFFLIKKKGNYYSLVHMLEGFWKLDVYFNMMNKLFKSYNFSFAEGHKFVFNNCWPEF